MKLLDENIRRDQAELLRRCRVPVRFLIEEFAPSGIQDPDIIALLHRHKGVTFFTHDRDFFRWALVHPAYCLVWLELFDGDAAEFIRRFLKHPAFDITAKRMGIVARVQPGGIQFWRQHQRRMQQAEWKV